MKYTLRHKHLRHVVWSGIAIILLCMTNSVSAEQSYVNQFDGYSIKFPNAPWELQPAAGKDQGAIIRNFPESSYGPQGAIPSGGVVIRVVPQPLDTEPEEHLRFMSRFGAKLHWETEGPPRVTYSEMYAGGQEMKTVATVLKRGDRCLKFILDFHADDSNAEMYVKVFDSIIASLTIQIIP